jgi:hypothetical protein
VAPSVAIFSRVEPALHEEFAKLAQANERTISAEVRRAMRRHLKAERVSAAKVVSS